MMGDVGLGPTVVVLAVLAKSAGAPPLSRLTTRRATAQTSGHRALRARRDGELRGTCGVRAARSRSRITLPSLRLARLIRQPHAPYQYANASAWSLSKRMG